MARDGMLVKRPLVVGEDFVLTGFKEKEWAISCFYFFVNPIDYFAFMRYTKTNDAKHMI